MKLSFEDIMERKHIAKSFCVPMRFTRLGPDDLGDHMCQMVPLAKELTKSYAKQQEIKELCWERFIRTFKWN